MTYISLGSYPDLTYPLGAIRGPIYPFGAIRGPIGATRSYIYLGWLLVGFVALRPKSTAMVIAGRSVHLTTLFPGQA